MSPELFRRIRLSVPIVLIAGLALLFARMQWASMTPSKPQWLPKSSVWFSGPHTPLEMHPVGQWAGCSAKNEKIAQCWLTDYKGSINFQGQFARLDGQRLDTLQIKDVDTRYSRKKDEVLWIVNLDQGIVLVPVQYLSDFDAAGHLRN
jgi:hypothetical protein